VFLGNGYGGQYLLVVPEFDLVVVFNSWNIRGGSSHDAWLTLRDRIIPALERGPSQTPPDGTAGDDIPS
jgi:hypothetical protein